MASAATAPEEAGLMTLGGAEAAAPGDTDKSVSATATTAAMESSASQASEVGPEPISKRDLSHRMWEITVNYFPLAFITFGGPPAHVALLLDRFVVTRKWLSSSMFAELFAICAALPGPASTQMAYCIALIRDGVLPGLWGFLIWSVPMAIIMAILGIAVGGKEQDDLPRGVLFLENGLAAAAVGLVALAGYALGNKLCKTRMTKLIAATVFALTVCYEDEEWLLPMCMVFGGLVAYAHHVFLRFQVLLLAPANPILRRPHPVPTTQASRNARTAAAGNGNGTTAASSKEANGTAPAAVAPTNGAASAATAVAAASGGAASAEHEQEDIADPDIYFSYSWQAGFWVLAAWLVCFVAAILLRSYANGLAWQVLGTFFYVGSIIFGGGPVVIPLLYTYVVESGWASESAFLLGLAIINCMPGPNFNFAAYCGALALRDQGVGAAIGGAALAWFGIFAPGLMLKTGILPLWRRYRGFPLMKVIFEGVNAAAVALVFTATYQLSQIALSIEDDGHTRGAHPIGSTPLYVAVAGVTFILVGFVKVPAPLMIVAGGCVGLLQWASFS